MTCDIIALKKGNYPNMCLHVSAGSQVHASSMCLLACVCKYVLATCNNMMEPNKHDKRTSGNLGQPSSH